MKLIARLILGFSRMPNLYAVDNPTFPVNQRYFHSLLNQEEYQVAIEICSRIYGIRMVYRETFLLIHLHLLDTLCKNAELLGLRRNGKHLSASRHDATRCGKRRAKPRHHPYSEISTKTVSQGFVQPKRGEIFK